MKDNQVDKEGEPHEEYEEEENGDREEDKNQEDREKEPPEIADSATIQLPNECSNWHHVLIAPSGNINIRTM